MKHVKLFEDFVNETSLKSSISEKVSVSYGAKGIIGKVLFAFKKEVEKIKYEGDADATLAELNEIWAGWADRDGAKIIEQEVMKAVKDKEAIAFITATLSPAKWILDEVNKMNVAGNTKFYVRLNPEFVINVGFADDVDANKFASKLDGMTNRPMFASTVDIVGRGTQRVGSNNVEIRGGLFLVVDAK